MNWRGPEEKDGENQSITKSRDSDGVRGQSNMAGFWISSAGFLPLMNTYGRGEMMYPSFLTAMMMPNECEREADGSLRIDRPLLSLLHMMEWKRDESLQ